MPEIKSKTVNYSKADGFVIPTLLPVCSTQLCTVQVGEAHGCILYGGLSGSLRDCQVWSETGALGGNSGRIKWTHIWWSPIEMHGLLPWGSKNARVQGTWKASRDLRNRYTERKNVPQEKAQLFNRVDTCWRQLLGLHILRRQTDFCSWLHFQESV